MLLKFLLLFVLLHMHKLPPKVLPSMCTKHWVLEGLKLLIEESTFTSLLVCQ